MIEHCGKMYARVSEVLQPLADYSHIKASVLKNKQDIGTMVHLAIEDFLNDDLPILTAESEGYFESFCKWRSCVKPKFVQTEQRYFNDALMLTGCLDAIANINGVETLVDYKTSVSESKTWILQAHLYYYLAKPSNEALASIVLFIKLSKDGTLPKVFPYKIDKGLIHKCLDLTREFWKNENKVTQKLDKNETLCV